MDSAIREALFEEVTFELRLKDKKIWEKSVPTGATTSMVRVGCHAEARVENPLVLIILNPDLDLPQKYSASHVPGCDG